MVRVPVVDAAGYLGKSVVREFKKRLLDQDGWEESVRKLSEIPFLAFHYVVDSCEALLSNDYGTISRLHRRNYY